MNTLSSEIYWLTLNVILVAVMVAPYAVYRLRKLGVIVKVFETPLPGDSPLYYFDIPYLKTTAWMVGLFATLILAFELLV